MLWPAGAGETEVSANAVPLPPLVPVTKPAVRWENTSVCRRQFVYLQSEVSVCRVKSLFTRRIVSICREISLFPEVKSLLAKYSVCLQGAMSLCARKSLFPEVMSLLVFVSKNKNKCFRKKSLRLQIKRYK